MDPKYFSEEFGTFIVFYTGPQMNVFSDQDLELLVEFLKFARSMGDVEPLKSFIGKIQPSICY